MCPHTGASTMLRCGRLVCSGIARCVSMPPTNFLTSDPQGPIVLPICIQKGSVASWLMRSSSKPTISGWNSPASSRSAASTCKVARGIDPRPDRAERRRQDHGLQPAHQIPAADARPHRLQRPRHHRACRAPTWRSSAWCARSRSRRCSLTSPCSRTCASRCSASAARRSTSGVPSACSMRSTIARSR